MKVLANIHSFTDNRSIWILSSEYYFLSFETPELILVDADRTNQHVRMQEKNHFPVIYQDIFVKLDRFWNWKINCAMRMQMQTDTYVFE